LNIAQVKQSELALGKEAEKGDHIYILAFV
jgi:hypothetical protein